MATGKIRPDVSLDEFVVMPNHIHGIIAITPESRRSRDGAALLAGEPATHDHTPLASPTQTIGAIVRGFKAATTKKIRIGAGRSMQVWQRGYYDHILEDEADLYRVREYIQQNPMRWPEDRNNPRRESTPAVGPIPSG